MEIGALKTFFCGGVAGAASVFGKLMLCVVKTVDICIASFTPFYEGGLEDFGILES